MLLSPLCSKTFKCDFLYKKQIQKIYHFVIVNFTKIHKKMNFALGPSFTKLATNTPQLCACFENVLEFLKNSKFWNSNLLALWSPGVTYQYVILHFELQGYLLIPFITLKLGWPSTTVCTDYSIKLFLLFCQMIDEDFTIMLQYLEELKGKGREKTKDDAEKLLKDDTDDDGS